jgi:uncharacterized protein GlcG (DUF336 family)
MGVPSEGSDDEPTHQARVAIEKAFRVEVAAAPRQLISLLRMVACVLVVIGAIAGPALTFVVVPGGFPVWATTTTIIGQLAVLALVAPLRLSR